MAITGFGMPGVMELVLIALLGSGVGLPVGVPPQDPDPMMMRVAPDKCLYFATWMGMATPDAASGNQTEQLFAEEEMQAFVSEVQRAAVAATARIAADAPQREMAVLTENAPLLITTLISHPTTILVESVTPAPGGIDAKGAVVVKLGEQADQVGGIVRQFLGTAPPEISKNVTIQGIECIELTLEEGVPKITVGQMQDYLIVAVGEKSFAQLLERSATPPPGWLTEAATALPVPRMASLAYADLTSIFRIASQLGGPPVQQVFGMPGFSSLGTAVSVTGLDATGVVSRARITSADADKGIGAFLTGKPLTAQDLAGIPQDASIALALRMDLQRVLDQGLRLLAEVEPAAAEDVRLGIQQIEQPLGIDVEDELLPSLGDVWTLHAAPSGGGLSAGWTLTVSLKDADKAQELHQTALRFANALFAQEIRAPRIRKFEHGGHAAYTLEVPANDFMVAPTWCLTDSHLVVTLLPQTMKSYLNRPAGSPSLAELPAVARVLGQGNGPCSLSYQDVRGQFETFYPLLQYATQVFARQLQRENFDVDATKLPSIAAVAPHLLPTVSAARKVEGGFESYSHATLPGANLGATAPVMVAALLPAIHSARKAAMQAQSTNNMKQIGLAMHNYHDVFKGMPAAYNVDEKGQPLLSWRVHVLPFIEQQALYDEFHLDEPWNSEHNRKLIARMPQVYRAPNSAADPGKTVYLGNAGTDGVFVAPRDNGNQDNGNQDNANQRKFPVGTRFRDILDGTSNTIMVVETADPAAVIWTKPDDFSLDEENPVRGLVGARPEVFLAGFCDGSVQSVRLNVDRDTLKALFTRAGGEVVRDWR